MKTDRLKELARELVQLKEKCMREGLYETGQALEPATQTIGWEIARHTEVAQIEHRLATNALNKIHQVNNDPNHSNLKYLGRIKSDGERCFNPNAAQLQVRERGRRFDYIFTFSILGEMLKLNVSENENTPYDHIELYLADPKIEDQIIDYIYKHLNGPSRMKK